MLLPQEDDNQLIANYLSTYGEQLRFRKQITKISAMGLEPSAKGFEDALKRDVQDRSTMGVANKTINVAEINKQLIAVRAAAMIDVNALPIGEEFNATEHFASLVEHLKAQKIRTVYETILQSLAVLGYVGKSRENTKRVG